VQAKPDQAIPLFETMIRRLEELIGRSITTGRFGAMMDVALINDGPVTLIIDSKEPRLAHALRRLPGAARSSAADRPRSNEPAQSSRLLPAPAKGHGSSLPKL
jgi:hypothetical protein